ncbi:hypothetical protein HanHA300_Chr09g0313891 [Helianthus annuus]|nr:hypothetical protein HanHA300_Chr09g0313891 [Helianthus annuus]KAJ0541983.1 hypothetical protein HanHA89_Chr09g0334761 [Helianthus annuus]KAJ0707048.1 hypothetical protein HanLR1_Chr09g0314111 [Helianthus annuus]
MYKWLNWLCIKKEGWIRRIRIRKVKSQQLGCAWFQMLFQRTTTTRPQIESWKEMKSINDWRRNLQFNHQLTHAVLSCSSSSESALRKNFKSYGAWQRDFIHRAVFKASKSIPEVKYLQFSCVGLPKHML